MITSDKKKTAALAEMVTASLERSGALAFGRRRERIAEALADLCTQYVRVPQTDRYVALIRPRVLGSTEYLTSDVGRAAYHRAIAAL